VAPDPRKRRSRIPWPMRTGETTTAAGTHDHTMPKWVRFNDICGFLLHVVESLVIACLLIYIIGRGEVRERQIQDTRDLVREQLCDVLDGLPEGGVLDLTRGRLHCGPGMPLESYPPEIQGQLGGIPKADRSAPRPELPASQAPVEPPTAPATGQP
jgi:hypothetical protein